MCFRVPFEKKANDGNDEKIYIKVCTVDLIVRLLETSVMKLTPNNLMMESDTVLTQYIITNW